MTENARKSGEGPLIPVIIPAYEPDERLLCLLEDFRKGDIRDVVIVDDGSGNNYKEIFEKARLILDEIRGCVLTHEVNRGKGRALKTAFAYVLAHYPDAIGVVTADSDGQHTADCIRSVRRSLADNPSGLILGVRTFDGENVPWKSAFGNKLTMRVLGYVSGVRVSDTQTGLRGIPRTFMQELINVLGERFEFETRMLLESAGRYPIEEVPIRTIYDSRENHQTHFDPLRDSIRIYRILGAKFIRYLFASLSSSILDLALFALFCGILRNRPISFPYVACATIFARILSATYNFTMNYRLVFRSRERVGSSAIKYVTLAIIQMGLSAILVTCGTVMLPMLPEVLVKALIDTLLFMVSYYVQRKYIF